MTFTIKGFRVIHYCTKASIMETPVNKKYGNYMKQILQDRTKRFICEERLLHWESILGILLQLTQGKAGLLVAIMRYANSRKC